MESTGGDKMVDHIDSLNWSGVSLSEIIERGLRLEASVYDVKGKKAKDIIKSCGWPQKTISGTNGIAEAYTCGRFKRIWLDYSEFPIYQPSSILDLCPEPDGYLSKKTNTDIERLRVHKGQVLITCSGTIGKVSLVSETLDNKIFSHDLLRITCKEKEDVGYLYAFAKSQIGNLILTTNQYGAVISHIEASHLDEVYLPYPEKSIRKKISDRIEKSFSLRDEANYLWERATKIIYSELKLQEFKDFKHEHINQTLNAFSVKLSDLQGRMDGSFHDKLIEDILQKLDEEAERLAKLGDADISEAIYLPQRFKRVYVDENSGTKMFGIKQITTLDPFTDKYLALGCITKKCKDELLLEPGTILISRSGTIGNMCIVPPHWKNWIASEDLIRIKVKKGLEGYVYCFLSSEYGKALVKKYAFGAVQDHIDCEQVSDFCIPILRDKKKIKEINSIVEQVNQKRNEAYLYEQEALDLLNKEVFQLN